MELIYGQVRTEFSIVNKKNRTIIKIKTKSFVNVSFQNSNDSS